MINRLATQADQRSPRRTDARQNIEDIYPLSPLQQGLLFHSLYAPDSGIYVEQLSCTIDGDLDVSAFLEAWRALVAAHPVLRTAFIWEGVKDPLQLIHRNVELAIERLDWRALSLEEQAIRWREYLAADRQRGFDFGKAPLMRLAIVERGPDYYYFLWTHHHILLDGWSTSLVFKDMLLAYESLRQGRAIKGTPDRPYRDYIAWIMAQDTKGAATYWEEALRGFEAPTPLGIDRHPAAEAESDYGKGTLTFSPDCTAALEAFTKRHHLTVNTLVQGVWALLLGRYSGQRDVAFGVTVSGRPAELTGVEEMVGLFINTLPLRVRLAPETNVIAWLKGLFEQNTELRRYEHTPLVEIQGWSEIPRGQPMFESLLVFENYPVDRAVAECAGDLGLRDVECIEQTNYPLTLVASLRGELMLRLEYDRSRFEEEAIARLLGHLQVLLDGVVSNPMSRLSELPLLTEPERHQLLVEWNATEAEYPKDKCIHEVFEAQVARTPEAVAVLYEDQQLTYVELNTKANQLAHHLHTVGVGPDVLVGMCVERSLEMVIGVLGVLKAGGAYVPIDPSYPKERIAFMVEDARPEVILTQTSLRELLPEHAGVISVRTEWGSIAQRSNENPGNCTSPQNLAYVIYTSGSTGRPKGVSMPHGGLVNLLSWQSRCSSARIKTLQLTTLSFDVSFQEIFSTFLQGGTVVLCDEGLRGDFDRLVSFVESQQVARLFLPFVALQYLAKSAGHRALGEVKEIITAGEQLQITRAIADLCQTTGCSLHNQYGPTESHVVTALPLQRDPASWPALPPIGQPIANTKIYLLDAHLNPVPVGVAGELHIGGVGLARGYLHRPDLTAERFTPNPFSNWPGERLYRTGDLARYRPDGNLEYLGRLDHQVKIRGFRIELGEVEAALVRHPQVREVVVVAQEDTPGDKRLVGYVVGEEPAPTGEELRAQLKKVLPEYMVPAAFVFLDALPLTPNGKVDRKALPAPDVGSQLAHRYVAPRNPTEEILVGIWAEVLGAERVGVRDNFFELGGHSILATQVVSRVRQAFDVDLPLRGLFTSPTVAALAQTIEEHVLAEITTLDESEAECALRIGAEQPDTVKQGHPPGSVW